MRARVTLAAAALCVLLSGSLLLTRAQTPQIPTLQVCNHTLAQGEAKVHIDTRKDATHTGDFAVAIELKCDSAGPGYPAGTLSITGISMSDSAVQGTITATTFEQVTTTGKHTPTVFLNGRCRAGEVRGARFWMMIANNKSPESQTRTPDIVSFLVVDETGKRVAYGTGPVVSGDIKIDPTPN